MWSWLASIIGGPVITGLTNAYKAKLDAANIQDRIANVSEMSTPMAAGSHIMLSSITRSTGAANTKPNIANCCASGSDAATPSFHEPNTITNVPIITATK